MFEPSCTRLLPQVPLHVLNLTALWRRAAQCLSGIGLLAKSYSANPVFHLSLGLQAQHDLPGMVDVWDHPTLLDYGVIVLLAQSLALVQTI